ncbi:MAG: hypothetical protein RL417_246 [Pseudomonadota bacterium]
MFARHNLFFIGLVIVFAVSFVTPIIVGTRIAGVRSVPSDVPADPTFPASKLVAGRSDGLAIAHHAALEPQSGEDFLVFGWFKPRVFPKDGQRMILFSKFSQTEHLGAGYALALDGENGALRPAVYWRDAANNGRWLQFAELPPNSRDWFLVALTLSGGRYLGVHGAFLNPEGSKPSLALLGGYDVKAIALPRSAAPLSIGWGGTRRFAGRIGPFGVFSLPNFSGDFDRLLKEISRNPLEGGELVDDDEVKFWSVDLEADLSSIRHEIRGLRSTEALGRNDEDDGA